MEAKQIQTIADKLMSQLQARKTTKEAFRFTDSLEIVENALEASYKVEVKSRNLPMNFDKETNFNIVKVSEWLVDKNKKPSLYLCGVCGSGKTTMIHAIVNLIFFMKEYNGLGLNHDVSVKQYTATEVVEEFAKNKDYPKSIINLKSQSFLIIDDLGTESVELQEYGNITRPIDQLLSYRYEHQLPTVISTNLKPSEIKERYGVRLSDRFREMFEIIVFQQNKSYRQ